ncbi:MAG: hypothetical protein FWG29_00360 [Treponema sp.]|nr:hypothetical protein [Treponema sp.]
MKIVYNHYAADEIIPVQEYIRNRKLIKYCSRETAAALVAAACLLKDITFSPLMPFYYETGIMESEDLGLELIADNSSDSPGKFSPQNFVEKGIKAVPPLTQFKALYNIPLSIVAIEHGLKGDNAVIYASASGLLIQALHAPADNEILLGCGKILADKSVVSGFALVKKEEIKNSPFLKSPLEAFELFKEWQRGNH